MITGLLLLLVLVGVVLYLVPMDATIKSLVVKIVTVVAVIVFVLWLCGLFGIGIPNARLP